MQAILDVLVFGAHPDDAEIGMGGTIAKHAAKGLKVGVCDLTLAELSSNGTVELRQLEAEQAKEALKVTVRTNLQLPDRGLVPTFEQIQRIVAFIRKYRPTIVFAPFWQDRHPDHIACSQLVKEAVFNAKLRRYMPEIRAWTVPQMYYYYINNVSTPDLVVDVSKHYEQKLNALTAYKSQFTRSGADTVTTPLNSGYVQQVERRDKLLGQQHAMQYAEGFAVEAPFVVETFL